ncbi:hypothetical protein Lw1_gp007 [Escherichia phage Lw1]|uniref:Uncharacterized protein n=2 Tax=Pseudotevenvirus TaxID=2842979 RepID=M9UXE5_9CAUD|nr:hypothetical protein RB16p007 [Escherichia phage RB16]YP_008060531.1 hypothetical protein Lw1_gp007 [Escherichia phage Lw1]ADJ55311.1 conserved hypothetical phage protein [Escherichia phage RB16]AGJ71416.1 hypothetical protein Lw1_gp007 [Escherichia phage Lw1]
MSKINETIPDDYGYADGFQPQEYCDKLIVEFDSESVSQITRINQYGFEIALTRMQVEELIPILQKIKDA